MEAVNKAMTEKISLLQGPPGTGKTTVLCGIVYSWYASNPFEEILVCASSNTAVEQCCLQLQKISRLKDKFVLVLSEKKQDWEGLKVETLLPYDIRYILLKSKK